MKTKFTINNEIFGGDITLEEAYKEYNKYYKEDGWLLDKENEDVYIILDKEINLKEGDRVNIGGIRIVDWKCVNIFEDIIEYALTEE